MKTAILISALLGLAAAAPAKPRTGSSSSSDVSMLSRTPTPPAGMSSVPGAGAPPSPGLGQVPSPVPAAGGGLKVVDTNPNNKPASEIAPGHHAKIQQATAPSKNELTSTHAEGPSSSAPQGLAVTANKITGSTGNMKDKNYADFQAQASKDAPREAQLSTTRLQNNQQKVADYDAQKANLQKTDPAAAEAMKGRPKELHGINTVHTEQSTSLAAQQAKGGPVNPANTGTAQGQTDWGQNKKADGSSSPVGAQFVPGCKQGPSQPGCGPETESRQNAGIPTTNFANPANIPDKDKQALAEKDKAVKAQQEAAKKGA
ncbi:hypothetical protein CAC42_3019 [Sphaceloma murrayae]|uniref:Uncharacterized protein n=1 Tax=Sphaceloma murrayae TaxID=2082308 RepID=A0A2K1QRB8_9PEZI|nr:hypothetical protein CAC42_3019 [Sphaceloma murrayae]